MGVYRIWSYLRTHSGLRNILPEQKIRRTRANESTGKAQPSAICYQSPKDFPTISITNDELKITNENEEHYESSNIGTQVSTVGS